MIHVVAVHTAMALVQPLTAIFKEILPEVKLNHIADDSLIQEVIANGCVTPAVRKRLLAYYDMAAVAGADVVFNTCSSVGDVAEMAKDIVSVPVFRIDRPMAQEAIKRAERIGVISTLPTTLGPTRRLLELEARRMQCDVTLVDGLAEGAFQAGQSGDAETHDRLIAEAATKIADQVELFVLAQGSMARMENRLAELTGKPVLSSPSLGVQGLRNYLATCK
jgi:Asp/Glu/hydantoin racemase